MIISIAPATLGSGAPLLPRRLLPGELTLTRCADDGTFVHLSYAVAGPAASPGLAHPSRLGDNAGMARDDSRAPSPLRVALRLTLDGARPSGTLEWVSAAVPAVTRAATGAGHWPPAAGSGPWPRGQALLAPG